MKYIQHDIGKCYPPLSAEEYAKLKARLHDPNDQKAPAIVYEGKILDGWHYYKACLEEGISPEFQIIETLSNPVEFVVRRNEGRRQLNDYSRADIALKLANLAHGSNRHKTKTKNVDLTNVGSTNAVTKTISQEQARTMMGASTGAIWRRQELQKCKNEKIHAAAAADLISLDRAVKIAKLPPVEQDAELEKWIAQKQPARPQPKVQDPEKVARKAREAELQAVIDRPSIYPEGVPLPVNARPEYTVHIQDGITELRKNEPLIGQMGRRKLFEDIHTYTQRIQTYGVFRAENRVTGEIDPRFVTWAQDVVSKLRAREQILYSQGKAGTRPKGNKQRKQPEPRTRKAGNEFSRFFHRFQSQFKKALEPFPFQHEEQLTAEITRILQAHFAAKREAFANRSVLHPNGAKTPAKN
jgi:hypothetical protein